MAGAFGQPHRQLFPLGSETFHVCWAVARPRPRGHRDAGHFLDGKQVVLGLQAMWLNVRKSSGPGSNSRAYLVIVCLSQPLH